MAGIAMQTPDDAGAAYSFISPIGESVPACSIVLTQPFQPVRDLGATVGCWLVLLILEKSSVFWFPFREHY